MGRFNFTNSLVDVRQNQTYPFTVDQNNATTFGSSRFSLAFTYLGSNVPIAAQSTSVCDPATAVVTISNSSSDFNYSLLSTIDGSVVVPAVAGNGSDLVLSVPADKLVAGSNVF